MRFAPRIHFALWFRRQDVMHLFAYALIALALVSACFVLPSENALENAREQRDRLNRESLTRSAQPASVEPASRLKAFREALGARQETERHIESLLAIARDKNLAVRKAEYRSAFNKSGQYRTYEVTIPFRAEYAAVRAFCDAVLRTLPFASIDLVQFSRNAVDVTDIDAKLVLTFYLTDDEVSAKAIEPSKRSATAIPIGAIIR